ncbi:hypothetical protein UFOVP961_21 [uncultured Caudovirales phage]|uniref:S1-like domain-containing protein n=1 Tax=uncultured Caudovirales phage TaxID=2100421 RepID=A0A6J5PYC6_9CAUD|nr:hypothetical protein UFOVP961_21 [uncultured Caudovirales phage]CAB4185535.1 hypothetical protein UFOVP1123_91 [uncultured Caudovirales phage]CAB4193316.1 hypothetical protein UFOVP1239_59 [uncultured Caudovirales phage]CAB4216148.1 hypothetical protein UFOVP1484_95 [uncultured Caudovirales phage]CAB5230775.1 hypothetical protein UFOVP1577_101 [uncultured Caudovirales phage]
MWSLIQPISGITNTVIIPTDGMITVSKPDGVEVLAYVNGQLTTPITQFWGGTGNSVYFEVKDTSGAIGTVVIKYGDSVSTIEVPAAILSTGTVVKTSAESTNIMEDTTMTPQDTLNLFGNVGQGGGAMGTGLGAGLVGGLLGTALFGRRGLGGLGDEGGGVAPVTLQGVESVVNNSAIMSQLADIKAAIPLAEGQAQLALAGAQMDISNRVTSSTGSVIASIGSFESNIMANLNMQTQINQKGFSDNAAVTVAGANANMIAIKDASVLAERNSWTLNQAITADGDKTRALIQSIDKSNDSRLITTLANEISELRNEGRLSTATGNITISNNNNANAIAQQQQAQQQQQQLAVLAANVSALYSQNQHIQQGILNIGSGTVLGTQTAANTRVS